MDDFDVDRVRRCNPLHLASKEWARGDPLDPFSASHCMDAAEQKMEQRIPFFVLSLRRDEGRKTRSLEKCPQYIASEIAFFSLFEKLFTIILKVVKICTNNPPLVQRRVVENDDKVK